MSPSKDKIFYCVANMQDGVRHTPKALKEDIEYLTYGDGVKYMFRILNALASRNTILLNGFRFCDRCIANIGLYLGCKIIILQHGRNEYFESRSAFLLIKKFFTVPRYKYELLFLLIAYSWFSLVRIIRPKLKINSHCNLFYFTDSYKHSWVKSQNNVNVKITSIRVNAPNPTTWGTEISIPRVSSYPVFLIDEPLDVTIGMSNENYFKLIGDLLVKLNIDEIYTRRHPRSDTEKFKYRPNIIETEQVPENVKVLIGYKSNLLFCGINADKFYQFDQDSLKAVNTRFLQNTREQDLSEYSDISKEAFLCD